MKYERKRKRKKREKMSEANYKKAVCNLAK